jgi:hypothetical protein
MVSNGDVFAFNWIGHMLRNLNNSTGPGNGVNRRDLLLAGAVGVGGLTLPSLQETQAAPSGVWPAFGQAKSVILFWLTGGPPQHECWDPKPDAPAAVRGEFGTIPTKTPGMNIGELMPRTAQLTDQLAVLRAVVSGDSAHSSSGYQMLTGVPHVPLNRENALPKTPNVWPSLGAIVRSLREDRNGIPTSITIPHYIANVGEKLWPGQDAGFIGRKNDPWLLVCDPSDPKFRIPALSLPEGVSTSRFDQRQNLLQQVNRHFETVQNSPAVSGFDRQTQQALQLISGTNSRQAFDLKQESEATRERYGRTKFGQSVLLSRRLIEAGASLVQVNWQRIEGKPNHGSWDTHEKHNECLKQFLMPMMDMSFSALVEDLDQRGMLDETIVAWVGEFGRTPKFNKKAGRDHWGRVFSVAFAGGGVRGGVVHGSSDARGAEPESGRVEPKDIAATIFHCLGYRPETEMYDSVGRPFRISQGRVISEIF